MWIIQNNLILNLNPQKVFLTFFFVQNKQKVTSV